MLSEPLETWPEDGRQIRAPRQMTVLINAAIVQGDDDGLCRIRNVSETGLMIETALPVALDQAVMIVLHSGRTFSCMPRWSKDGRVGLSCESDPTEALLDEGRAGEPDARDPWLPRFYRTVGMQIAANGFVHRCTLDSISSRDVIVTDVPTPLRAPQIVTICIPHLGDFGATVRASENGAVYARFTTPVGFGDLSRWLTPAPWMPMETGRRA